MSDFSEICDQLIGDLTENVNGLRPCIVHRYAPWDPGELQAESGERHLAVWPAPAALETEMTFTTMSQLNRERYVVAYWEPTGDAAKRGFSDEEAAAELFELHDATVARLYQWSNQVIGAAFSARHETTELPSRLGTVRYFALTVQVQRPKEFV